MSTIITVLIGFVVIGLILWLINTMIPMPAVIKNVLNVVIAIILLLWALQKFGLLSGVNL